MPGPVLLIREISMSKKKTKVLSSKSLHSDEEIVMNKGQFIHYAQGLWLTILLGNYKNVLNSFKTRRKKKGMIIMNSSWIIFFFMPMKP